MEENMIKKKIAMIPTSRKITATNLKTGKTIEYKEGTEEYNRLLKKRDAVDEK